MKALIQSIQAHLAQSVTALQYVDIDWGQVDLFGDPPPVKFPCALIEIRSANFDLEGALTQRGWLSIEIRLLDLILSNSSFKAPITQRDKALRLFDLSRDVFVALHGWHPATHCGPMTRRGFSKINRDDGLKEYRQQFRVQIMDNSAADLRTAPATKIRLDTSVLRIPK